MRFASAAIFAALGMLSSPAVAVNFSCGGVVNYLGLNMGGNVVVNLGYGFHAICNISNVTDGVDGDTCRAAYSLLLAANTTKRPVLLYFDSNQTSVGGATNCGALGTWVTRVPYYVEQPN